MKTFRNIDTSFNVFSRSERCRIYATIGSFIVANSVYNFTTAKGAIESFYKQQEALYHPPYNPIKIHGIEVKTVHKNGLNRYIIFLGLN